MINLCIYVFLALIIHLRSVYTQVEADHPLLLHIGGLEKIEGWTNVNAQINPELFEYYNKEGKLQSITPGIDVINRMDNLSFVTNSVSAIYASHVLEHTAHGTKEIYNTLR